MHLKNVKQVEDDLSKAFNKSRICKIDFRQKIAKCKISVAAKMCQHCGKDIKTFQKDFTEKFF